MDKEKYNHLINELDKNNPGEDNTDPYKRLDIQKLPQWWVHAVEVFERHNFRPYQPPRFEDGALKRDVIEKLENDLDLKIQFICFNPQKSECWDVLINGVQISKIGYRRSAEGYTIFEMTSREFKQIVADESCNL
ncbi:hypothetical protein HUB97_14535 [Halorubraceae archaeon YAN]|nr:hypothetical protein [Halorubraceae archaeon YAN]